jgi:hypothetical protein
MKEDVDARCTEGDTVYLEVTRIWEEVNAL